MSEAAEPHRARRDGGDPWRRPAHRPLVVAHRGASASHLENTMAAFVAARAAGADGIELDVRLCATGEVVVFHDEYLTRLAGRGEPVARLSLADLRAVELDGGHRIVTLDEVLDAFASADFTINIEIKTPGYTGFTPLVDAVLACVARHDAAEKVMVSSFDPVILLVVRRRARTLRTGLLCHAGQLAPLRHGWSARLLAPYAIHPEHTLVSPARLARWQRSGLAVHVWTVDDVTEQRHLAAMGVDMIMTNDPAACLAALA